MSPTAAANPMPGSANNVGASANVGSLLSHVLDAILESPVGPFAQELVVLIVFGVSFLLWRSLGQGARSARSPKRSKVEGKECFRASVSSTESTRSSITQTIGIAAPVRRRFTSGSTQCSAGPTTSQNFTRNRTAAPGGAEKTMLQHLEQREFTRALNLFRALERDGRDIAFSEELYSSFIQSAIRVGKTDVVERMLQTMKRNELVPSNKFWQTTLKMLSSRKNFTACLNAVAIFGTQMPLDKVVLSCLINAALEVGMPDKACSFLDEYSKVELDAKDHVLFFRTYQTLQDPDAAEAVFHKLGKETTNLMLNLLLLSCVNTKQPERALKVLRDAHAYEAEGVREPIVDVVSYNTIIKGFAQDGDAQSCFECLNEMRSKSVEPDAITFGTLLDLCISDNQVGVANEIIDLLINLLMNSKRPLDTVMCTLFIKGLVRANCLDRAIDLCEEMKQRKGARPDVITYSVLIKAMVDRHALDRALALFNDMIAAGYQPDDIIYTHLLEGCRHANQHSRGQELFQQMLDSKVKPSEFTLVTMLKLHGRCGFHKEAFDLVAKWEEQQGMKPSVIHFTCLMSGCLRTKSYEQAWQAYELMRVCGVKPDSMTLSTLLPGMVAAQQWERVVILVEAATSDRGCSIPAETLNNALSQMQGAGGQGRHIDQLRALMDKAGMAHNNRRNGAYASSRRGPAGKATQ